MTEFTSEIKTIPHNEKIVFETLSDLNNLRSAEDRIPEDKIKDLEVTADSVSFSVSLFGKVTIYIVEREPNNSLKFAADGLPVDANLWIQLKQIDENETEMQVILKADLNPFIKSLASKPLQKGVGKMADILESLPFV